MRFRVQIEQEGVHWWETWTQDTEDPEACAKGKVARYNAMRSPLDPVRKVLKVRVPRNRHPRQMGLKLTA